MNGAVPDPGRSLGHDLARMLNYHGMDAKLGIPDWALADYVLSHLDDVQALSALRIET